MMLMYLQLILANSFKFDVTSATLAPWIYLIMAAVVENIPFQDTGRAATRVGFSVGASLSGENLLERWMGG